MHSHLNNYLHHNHYEHVTNLSRSDIALMLLSELISTDGADFDWTPYLSVLLHMCLVNFDSTRQLVGEHAKKLFMNILYVLTIQCELYELTDFLLTKFDTVLDNQSIIFDRKYTNNNCVDSANPLINGIYNASGNTGVRLSTGNCHYNYLFNPNVFANLKGVVTLEPGKLAIGQSLKRRALKNMNSEPVSPSHGNVNGNNDVVFLKLIRPILLNFII